MVEVAPFWEIAAAAAFCAVLAIAMTIRSYGPMRALAIGLLSIPVAIAIAVGVVIALAAVIVALLFEFGGPKGP